MNNTSADNTSLDSDNNQLSQYKKLLRDYIIEEIKPNYFISIQPPFDRKTQYIPQYEEETKFIMKQFEKALLGRRWNKHHFPFVIISENDTGKSTWHSHILGNFTNILTGQQIAQDQLEHAMDKADHSYRVKYGTKKGINVKIDRLDNEQSVKKAASYCTKEIWCQFLYDSEPARSETSCVIFGLENDRLDTRIKQKLLAGTNA